MRDRVRTILLCILVVASSSFLTGTVHGSPSATHAPIVINGDSGFTTANGVVSGTGVATDPYLIQGWTINSTTSRTGINITNTRSYFAIRNVQVSNYRFQYTGIGIWLANVTNGAIQTSTLFANRIGAYLWNTSNVTFSGNDISNNTAAGITAASSANLTFTANRFNLDGIYFERAQTTDREWSTYTITPDNIVNGMPIAFYKACSGLTVDGARIGELLIANCNKVKLVNLSITNTDIGVELGNDTSILIANSTLSMNHQSGMALSSVHNCTIQGVTASSNYFGLDVFRGSNLTITDSVLSSNGADGIALFYNIANVTIQSSVFARNGRWGLSIFEVTSLHVFHNDFISNNLTDVDYGSPPSPSDSWDNGYPSGGNYWTRYNGVDVCSGDRQDFCKCAQPTYETCPDGIGDTPYPVTSYYSLTPTDRYPLMRPYHPDTTPPVWASQDGFQPGLNSEFVYLRPTSVWLYWTTATDDVKVTSYRIYSNNRILANVTASQNNVQGYNVTGLTPGTTYNFQVVAIDVDGNIGPPISLTVTTPVIPASSAPLAEWWYLAPTLVAAVLAVIIAIFTTRHYYRRRQTPNSQAPSPGDGQPPLPPPIDV